MAEEREGSTGRGLGVGEVKVDAAGEGDGCDRCGCPDEEKCCQGFWNDAGVPPIWPLSWIMDPKNKYLNDNKCARIFGNIGFGWFDKERKAFMGTALALTVVAIVITGFGCFALSDDDSIIFYTTWGISYMKYTNADGVKVGQIAYLGLRKFLRYECLDTSSGSNWREWADCTEDNVWWSAVECGSGGTLYYGYRCDEVEHCSEAAQASQFGAFMTAATLVFAMLGCLTRIRKVADTNWQKVRPRSLSLRPQWQYSDPYLAHHFPTDNTENASFFFNYYMRAPLCFLPGPRLHPRYPRRHHAGAGSVALRGRVLFHLPRRERRGAQDHLPRGAGLLGLRLLLARRHRPRHHALHDAGARRRGRLPPRGPQEGLRRT